ncbi:hypothetical protein GGI15_000544 [Coemansia interrupta]|uniref:Uncharacterized protein n=1 Tax=Coemansia interrupta TaxID=1126814 RepID=A0A9W8HN05_9FUNG|nr:hypothetical protein GGI15_000544 [Coemansia interrupta]
MKFSAVCPVAALCVAAPLVLAHAHEAQYNHAHPEVHNQAQYAHPEVHNQAQYAHQEVHNQAQYAHPEMHNQAQYNNGQYNNNNGQYTHRQYDNNQMMQLQEATQADNLALARVRESQAQINRASQLATAYPGAQAQNIRNCHMAASEALARADQAVQRAAESLRY